MMMMIDEDDDDVRWWWLIKIVKLNVKMIKITMTMTESDYELNDKVDLMKMAITLIIKYNDVDKLTKDGSMN